MSTQKNLSQKMWDGHSCPSQLQLFLLLHPLRHDPKNLNLGASKITSPASR